MADTIKSSAELKLGAAFADSDDRTITLQNPKNNLSAADIQAVETIAQTTQAIIGDKKGAAFVNFKSAVVHETTKMDLDLTLLSE